jgi:hypothetical protein
VASRGGEQGDGGDNGVLLASWPRVRVMGARPGHADGVSATEVGLRSVHGLAERLNALGL